MSSVREQFREVQELLDQVHSLVDSNTPSDLNKAATILKSLLPKYKDLSVNEESKRPENLEILKEIKSRLTEETQRVMNKKEEAKNLQQQQQQLQHQQLQQQQQQQILESNTRSKPQELPKPPLLSGYLKKQGDKGLVKSFKKRWFQQRDTKLYYYDKEGDSEPYGFVNLPDMINVKTVDSGFELATPSRVYIFQVFKPSDLNYWTEGLKDFKKYYQSLQNSQKFGGGGGSSSPLSTNMASSNSFSDFRKFSDVPPSASQRTPVKDRRGTISGGSVPSNDNSNHDNDYETKSGTNSNLSASYAPTSSLANNNNSNTTNQNDEDLKRREAEIIRKNQEKVKKEQEEQEQQQLQQQQLQQKQQLEQQLQQQLQQQQDYQSQSQPQQASPSQSPYSSRHGSMNYSQQQQPTQSTQSQQQQQTTQSQPNPQVIISNNNSPRFESQQQHNQNQHHDSKVNLESFRKSIEDDLTKKFVKEKQELMEFEIKKRLEMENELKNVNTLLEQSKFESELKQKQSTIDLKKKKDEIEELTVQVNVLSKRNETMDSKIKQLESITPIETFPHEFLWTEEVTSRDQKIAAQNKRILELEEQLKLKDNAVSVIKRENEMLRQETEKKDKYINELLSKGGNSGSSNYQSQSQSSSKSSQTNHHGDDKIKESMVAHQTQNSFLLQEIQRLETQSQFKLDIKLQQIDELEKQLEQQLYQFHRFREAIIGTLSNEYCDKLEKENLDIKKEFFQILGVSIKLHRVREGIFENVDINSLFDKVIKENVHYRNWPEWISNQLRSTNN